MSEIALIETIVLAILAALLLIFSIMSALRKWGCPAGGWHKWKVHETAHGRDYIR